MNKMKKQTESTVTGVRDTYLFEESESRRVFISALIASVHKVPPYFVLLPRITFLSYLSRLASILVRVERTLCMSLSQLFLYLLSRIDQW